LACGEVVRRHVVVAHGPADPDLAHDDSRASSMAQCGPVVVIRSVG
jgi:hypothetical protein